MNRTILLFVALALTACNGVSRYKCLARQAEAKQTLQSIKTAEASYATSHSGKYTASTSDLSLPISPRYYSIELSIKNDGAGYTAIAKGDKPETMGDQWSIDESGTLKSDHDKCHE